MASSVEDSAVLEAPVPAGSKPAFVQLLIAIVAAVMICVSLLAGLVYYLAKTGRLGTLTAGGLVNPTITKSESTPAPSTHAMVLEPMVVNLADADGKTYLRLGLTLRVLDPELKKGEKAKEEQPKEGKTVSDADAAVRDTALEVLGHQTAETLLAAQGKEQLKTELKAAIARRNPELKVAEVFFTEFLVQR
jgi:flagellar protein FliL